MRKMSLLVLVAVLASPLLMLSCRPTEPLYPLEPQVLILSPAVGSTFSPGPIVVKTYIENLSLVDKAGQDNVAGEGHIIYYLDVMPPVTMGESAIPDSGQYAISTDTTYTWPNVPAGDHILAAQVVNNDNTPIRYPSAVRVNITVK